MQPDSAIPGASTNPLDWGLPNISIKGFTPLTDIAPQYRNDATLQFSETAIWNKHKHNVRFGGDFRRLWTTLRSNANPRGSFTFTGFATGNAFSRLPGGDAAIDCPAIQRYCLITSAPTATTSSCRTTGACART